jgi:hypothetical protein
MYSTFVAYLLWFLSGFGSLGFHRFYLGKIPTWLIWMCTGGLFGLGSIYDLLTLPSQVREANIRLAAFRRPGEKRREEAPQWRYAEDAEARIIRPEPRTKTP